MKNLLKLSLCLVWTAFIGSGISGCKKDSVSKTNPVISWENPADVDFGTLLSSIQLNATADVPGSFIYTPALGTKLSSGLSQDLKVVFTPSDAGKYASASKTVKINVLPDGTSSAVFNPSVVYDTLTDIDGHVYKTVTIGTQIWMAENLRATHYRNGDSVPSVTLNVSWKNLKTGACCTYENTADKNKIATEGRLYNWYAVSDSRNIAPVGWHVPTDAEWTILTTFLGGEAAAGGKMKESGTLHWNSPNTGAVNSSGFTAIPSGKREYSDGTFLNLGYDCFYWSSTAYDINYSWYRYLHYDVTNVYRANFHGQYGHSIRCVKD